MSTTSSAFMLLVVAFIACFIAVSHGAATTAALEAQVSTVAGKFITKFTTQDQNIGYIRNIANCTFYETNMSVCTDRMLSVVKSNLTSSQLSSAMGAATKFLTTAGGDIESQASKMVDAIIGVIQKPIITPVFKKKAASKTVDAYELAALKIVKKKAKKGLVCKAANACKKVFANDWTAAKNAFSTIVTTFTLCGV